jgi:hypothetical protein
MLSQENPRNIRGRLDFPRKEEAQGQNSNNTPCNQPSFST